MLEIDDYLSKQWFVLPLEKKSKRPARFLHRGYLGASNNKDVVERWFEDTKLNIGINLVRSNLVVLDFDERNILDKQDFISIFQQCKESDTYTVKTADGYHFYFTCNTNDQFKGKIIDGIDIKHKGYVAAPPSIHPSGIKYEVINNNQPARLPLALRLLMQC